MSNHSRQRVEVSCPRCDDDIEVLVVDGRSRYVSDACRRGCFSRYTEQDFEQIHRDAADAAARAREVA